MKKTSHLSAVICQNEKYFASPFPEKLASIANMSVKSFQRKFITYVGVNPKLFAQICRFNHLLEYKLKHPESIWSQISDVFGFYDPMHLVKEFRHFAGQSPTSFFSSSPPPKEEFFHLSL